MKAKDFYWSFFGSKLLEKIGIAIVVIGFIYWIVEAAISIIQKW
jgi:hypothetical protein